jgi:guanylate kinase
VEDRLAQGQDVILEIEVVGAMKVRERCPEAVFLFILPPSLSELERRLRKRGTEAEEVIQNRVAQASREIGCAAQYDYLVVNGELSEAVEDVNAILRAVSCQKEKNQTLLEEVLGK